MYHNASVTRMEQNDIYTTMYHVTCVSMLPNENKVICVIVLYRYDIFPTVCQVALQAWKRRDMHASSEAILIN